jgi:hypothetical protein
MSCHAMPCQPHGTWCCGAGLTELTNPFTATKSGDAPLFAIASFLRHRFTAMHLCAGRLGLPLLTVRLGLPLLTILGCLAVALPQVYALSPEELVGDNQYYCDTCGTKCDAERQMRLRSLPPYLGLSLQRFVFDMQVQTCH